MKISSRYRKTLEGYLLWRVGDFLRVPFLLDLNGPTAAESMMLWESTGRPLPVSCSEPELLADYVQGKRSRDWHITEWRDGISRGYYRQEDFLGTLGVRTRADLESIFG
jgi:hypothetical protein